MPSKASTPKRGRCTSALAVRERALGPDHVDLTETLVGLASVRKEQGYNAEALALYRRALAIKERPFSADHPELEEIRSNIDVLSP